MAMDWICGPRSKASRRYTQRILAVMSVYVVCVLVVTWFVRSLLGAIAGVMAMSAFVDFLRSYNAIGALPPFTEFVVFWVLFGVVQGVQSVMYSADKGE
ncbi:MAG: hypothetical protein V4555_03390 [Acidobacteriota bacterium]